MRPTQWNTQLIKQFELETGEAMLQDVASLFVVNRDFGGIAEGHATAVYKSSSIESLSELLKFANRNQLPITIRGQGLGQAGQALAPSGTVLVDVSQLNSNISWENNSESLVVGCSVSWKLIVETALTRQKIPYIVPYNTNLQLGGVLSVGGVGAASFKQGIIGAQVIELEIITAEGKLVQCNQSTNKDLFDACLSGQGQFGVIYSAKIALRPCLPHVRVYNFSYKEPNSWLNDQFSLKKYADYLEAYVLLQNGAKKYFISAGVEYNDQSKLDMSILDYTYRHDERLQNLKDSHWNELHPWYECYISRALLAPKLDEILNLVPECLGGMCHLFPIAKQVPKFFMLPPGDDIMTFNILTPGITAQQFAEARENLLKIDQILLKLGGKRYISGWFDTKLPKNYWQVHYGDMWALREKLKTQHDKARIFNSYLKTT